MDYKKHRERLTRARESLTRPHLSFSTSDAAELLDKAEQRDKAVWVAEDLAAHIVDALGYLTTMHESFQNHSSDEAVQLLTDAIQAGKKKSISKDLAADPAPVEEGKGGKL